MNTVYPLAAFLLIAWGAFAFGAVYDWAYTPLAVGSALVGAAALVAPGRKAPPFMLALAAAFAIVLAAASLQLVPLSAATIAWLSPATDRFLVEYNVAYALARAQASGARHALSINPPATWRGIGLLASFGLLGFGMARALGRRRVQTLAVGLTIVGFGVALAGIVQSGLYTRDPALTLKVYGFWKPVNASAIPFGPFINRNHFAGWMLLALPVAMGYFCALVERGMRGVRPTFRDRLLWLSSREASQAILVGFALPVMALSLVLTLSRSGIACFVAAVAGVAVLALRRQSSRSKRSFFLVFAFAVVASVIGWAGLDALAARFASSSTDLFHVRWLAWRDAWGIVRDFPLAGTGLNTYGYATLFYQTTDFGGHFVEAHNDYLQLLAEGGLLLAIPAAVLVLALGREIRRAFEAAGDDATTYWLRAGATIGLVAIGLQEIVEFSLQMPGIAALFAVTAGIALHRPSN